MSECPATIRFGALTAEHVVHVGGKCASLGAMSQAGLPVPPGFAVTTVAFADAKRNSGGRRRITEIVDATLTPLEDINPRALAEVAARARAEVLSWSLSEAHEGSIRQMYAELCELSGVADVPVAVRSSATVEDSPDASFAGEHDTYLWVCGIEEVLEKVRQCWASLYTERAIVYRHEMGYDHNQVDMAVAVQKMVRPRAAGVAFTLDPSNGDRSAICIDAAWGFGEGVVAGDVTPDNFLVDKVMFAINRRTISAKTHAHLLVATEGGAHPHVIRVELPDEQADTPSLTDEEIVAVAKLARAAEKHYGRPQDIEWAVDEDLPAGEDVVLLQARPETVWSRKHHPVGAKTDAMASIVDTLVNPLYAKKKGAQPV
jgi:pyruvate,water dikinase